MGFLQIPRTGRPGTPPAALDLPVLEGRLGMSSGLLEVEGGRPVPFAGVQLNDFATEGPARRSSSPGSVPRSGGSLSPGAPAEGVKEQVLAHVVRRGGGRGAEVVREHLLLAFVMGGSRVALASLRTS